MASSIPLPAVAVQRKQWIVYATAAILFTLAYMLLTVEYRRATLIDLTNFQADRPFQYRLIIPLVARILGPIIPLPLRLLYAGLTATATLALLFAYRSFLESFYSRHVADRHALLLLYPLIWNYCIHGRYFYPSDIPAILFFVLGLTLLTRRRWSLFYLVFILATLNRETGCFLTLAFAVTLWKRLPWKRLAAHLLAQSILWVCLKTALAHAFAANPGQEFFENHLAENLVTLASPFHLPPHNLSRVVTFLSCFGLAWLLVPPSWPALPGTLKRLLIIVVPFVAGMAVVGNLHELRIYAELVPVVMASTVPALEKILTRPGTVDRPTASPGSG